MFLSSAFGQSKKIATSNKINIILRWLKIFLKSTEQFSSYDFEKTENFIIDELLFWNVDDNSISQQALNFTHIYYI